jgi:hypothetical protein
VIVALLAIIFLVAATVALTVLERERRRGARLRARRERPATLEAGGSHLSADRRAPLVVRTHHGVTPVQAP